MRGRGANRLAQAFTDVGLGLPTNKTWQRALLGLHSRLRLAIVRRHDPLIEYELEGTRILVPLSHNMPYHRKAEPLHSLNLGRIASYVEDHHPGMAAIDIGANVGDSVCILRAAVPGVPILCIDGDPGYFRILRENLAGMSAIEFEECLLGSDIRDVPGELLRTGGSAKFVVGEGWAVQRVTTLVEALERHPLFKSAKLVKTDTDGYDCEILDGAIDMLAEMKPVVFLEYDPIMMSRLGRSGTATLAAMAEKGYRTALVYKNSGELMMSLQLSDADALRELDGYLLSVGRSSGSVGSVYVDLCVFHEADNDLARHALEAELAFFTAWSGSS